MRRSRQRGATWPPTSPAISTAGCTGQPVWPDELAALTGSRGPAGGQGRSPLVRLPGAHRARVPTHPAAQRLPEAATNRALAAAAGRPWTRLRGGLAHPGSGGIILAGSHEPTAATDLEWPALILRHDPGRLRGLRCEGLGMGDTRFPCRRDRGRRMACGLDTRDLRHPRHVGGPVAAGGSLGRGAGAGAGWRVQHPRVNRPIYSTAPPSPAPVPRLATYRLRHDRQGQAARRRGVGRDSDFAAARGSSLRRPTPRATCGRPRSPAARGSPAGRSLPPRTVSQPAAIPRPQVRNALRPPTVHRPAPSAAPRPGWTAHSLTPAGSSRSMRTNQLSLPAVASRVCPPPSRSIGRPHRCSRSLRVGSKTRSARPYSRPARCEVKEIGRPPSNRQCQSRWVGRSPAASTASIWAWNSISSSSSPARASSSVC